MLLSQLQEMRKRSKETQMCASKGDMPKCMSAERSKSQETFFLFLYDIGETSDDKKSFAKIAQSPRGAAQASKTAAGNGERKSTKSREISAVRKSTEALHQAGGHLATDRLCVKEQTILSNPTRRNRLISKTTNCTSTEVRDQREPHSRRRNAEDFKLAIRERSQNP